MTEEGKTLYFEGILAETDIDFKDPEKFEGIWPDEETEKVKVEELARNLIDYCNLSDCLEERAKELARFLYDLIGKPIEGTHDEAVEANAQRKLALHVLTKYGLEEYL